MVNQTAAKCRARTCTIAWLGLATFLTIVKPGFAQDSGLGTSNGLPAGLATNPFASPYMNPFLNPAATAGAPISRDELLIYYMAARQRNSVRDRAADKQPVRPVAEMPYHAMRPGGTTSGSYFSRTTPRAVIDPSAPAAGHSFGRTGSYFRNNGR
jgi:hypothetical protein